MAYVALSMLRVSSFTLLRFPNQNKQCSLVCGYVEDLPSHGAFIAEHFFKTLLACGSLLSLRLKKIRWS
jgi:hypothetical protein